MNPFVVPTDMVVQGGISSTTLNVPSGTITNAMVNSAAAIAASKLEHPVRKSYAQGSSTAATAATQVIHRCRGATGAVVDVYAGAVVPAVGADTCTVDIKKGGVSILSAPISLTSAQSARQAVAGAVITTALAVGDVLEVVVAPSHSSGTLAQGIFVELYCREDAA